MHSSIASTTMRLTITKKIAMAVIGIVMLSIGTMAWLTSQNLRSGFIAYLNETQAHDLDKLSGLLAEHYRLHGNLESFRENRPAMRDLIDSIRPRQLAASGEASNRLPPDRPPPRPGGRPPHRLDGDAGRSFDEARPPPPEDAPPPRMDDAPPQPLPARPPPDPMGFGSRLSLLDQGGRPLIGPPDTPPGTVRTIVVDGRQVGSLSLAPLREIAGASDIDFIQTQIHDILWLAVALILFSVLLAVWLARQLLRPVAALRSVTQQIAQGQFEARAPVLNRDELSELAQHVNSMAQALELGEQQRRRMLADISHELRTPLTVIRGEIEALLDGIRQADPRALDSLHAEVLRLNKLVDDLHQITLADSGDLRYQRQVLDLGALLQTIVERFRTRAAAAGLELSVSPPVRTIWVDADPDRLAQIISNLLENSVRYTDSGGRIACSLSAGSDCAELIVEDSAPGVDPGIHERLFERLYRIDLARSRDRGGSGLGLSICKAMIEAQGGSIRAMASNLGGIKMMVHLPLVAIPN